MCSMEEVEQKLKEIRNESTSIKEQWVESILYSCCTMNGDVKIKAVIDFAYKLYQQRLESPNSQTNISFRDAYEKTIGLGIKIDSCNSMENISETIDLLVFIFNNVIYFKNEISSINKYFAISYFDSIFEFFNDNQWLLQKLSIEYVSN